MSKELIVRISAYQDEDVEILYNDLFKEKIIEKKISLVEFSKILDEVTNEAKERVVKLEMLDKSIVALGSSGTQTNYLIKQEQKKRYITYSFGENSAALEINFPNSLYLVATSENRIRSIEAYMYCDWEDKNTKLYKYAMPNMLSGNKICLGSADTEIKNCDVIETLEKIIYCPYSHARVDNVKGFSNTKEYFEYLNKNNLDAKYLFDANKKLVDLLG